MRVAELATNLYSLAFPSLSWGLLEGFQFRFSPNRVQDLLAIIQDENENPIIPYFRDRIIPLILKEKPDLVGISLNHFSQFIPGLSLCRLLRTSEKRIPIILGGETLTEVVRSFDLTLPFSPCLILLPLEKVNIPWRD